MSFRGAQATRNLKDGRLFKISPFGRNDKEEVEMTEMAVIQSSRADKSFQLMNTPRLYSPLSDSGKEINGNFTVNLFSLQCIDWQVFFVIRR